jgi:hypothetical protein
MILFFGTREVKQDDPNGTAQLARCPACGQTVTLQPRVGRMYFHIFWCPSSPWERHNIICNAQYAGRATRIGRNWAWFIPNGLDPLGAILQTPPRFLCHYSIFTIWTCRHWKLC